MAFIPGNGGGSGGGGGNTSSKTFAVTDNVKVYASIGIDLTGKTLVESKVKFTGGETPLLPFTTINGTGGITYTVNPGDGTAIVQWID